MMAAHIQVPPHELAEFCQRNGIKKLSLFGSVLTSRFTDQSDIDVLVEFAANQPVGYLKMAALERELSGLFGGRKVDLRTPRELSPYFRDEVVNNAALQYAA